MTDKAYAMIGLATRAGRTASGEVAVHSAVKKHKAFLIIIARDVSPATMKSYTDMGSYYKVPVVTYGTMEGLGACCGREFRAAAAVLDRNFAETIRKLIENKQ